MVSPDGELYTILLTCKMVSATNVELELPGVFQFFADQRKLEFEEHPEEAVSYDLKVTGRLASREQVIAEAKFKVTFFVKGATYVADLPQDKNIAVE